MHSNVLGRQVRAKFQSYRQAEECSEVRQLEHRGRKGDKQVLQFNFHIHMLVSFMPLSASSCLMCLLTSLGPSFES